MHATRSVQVLSSVPNAELSVAMRVSVSLILLNLQLLAAKMELCSDRAFRECW